MEHTVAACIEALKSEDLLEKVNLDSLLLANAVSGLCYDNRLVKKGDLFVCKGVAFKAPYLDAAMKEGALFYVSDRVWNAAYPYVIVKDIRLAMAVIAKWFYGESVEKLVTVGVTGTKGKTTVSTFLNAILNSYSTAQGRCKNALIGSLVVFDGVNEIPSKLSTPEALDLWRYLADAEKNRAQYAVCEMSSQGLKYHRATGLMLDVAIFLNIGEDHISDVEHKDFEDYFVSKLKIFDNAHYACINSSADYFERICDAAIMAGCEVITFGFRPEDTLRCVSVESGGDGSQFTVSWKNQTEETYSIAMAGRYNVDNALASLAAAYLLDIPREHKQMGIRYTTVAGRGVRLSTKDGALTVIIDYAHNKISLAALYDYVRENYPDRKVITVFGCPGGKAQNRRLSMGSTAGLFSDYVIITEDDPDKESLADICREIADAVEKTDAPYEIIYDRKEAIQKAFVCAEKNGVILLCGKGAEKAQKRNGQAVFYETDEYIASQCISEYNQKSSAVPIV